MGFGVILAILLIVCSLGLYKLKTLNDSIVADVDYGAKENGELSQASASAFGASMAMRNLIFLTDAKDLSNEKSDFDARIQDYEKAYSSLATLFDHDPTTADEEHAWMSKISDAYVAAMPSIKKVVQLGQTNDPDAARYLMTEAGPAFDKWIEILRRFEQYELQSSTANAEAAHATYRTAVTFMLSFGAVSIAVALLVGWRISRSIERQLGGEPAYAAALVARLADGDLTADVVLRNGLGGSLMHSMASMRDKIAAAVEAIHFSTDHVTTAAREISAGNIDLSARTEEQAASLEQTAASMTELTQTVRNNTENAREANALVSNATNIATASSAAVQHMVATMSRIHESSRKISDITSVIEGIAFQTNILALNAAVEAARAGESGRGFAVVASEVRSLAQRSAVAAKEIKELIVLSVQLVSEGAQQADEVVAKVDEVNRSIRSGASLVAEISTASYEQAKGIEQINEAIGQMDLVTQQNAALVEQAAAAASSLNEQSLRLSDAVSVFKVKGRQAA